MNNFKHTPGPWQVIYYDSGDLSYRDHNGPCPSISASEEEDVCIVHWDGFKQEYWSSANGNQEQIEANAHLIAAAPDLLEALSWLIQYVEPQDDPSAALPSYDIVIEAIYSAISKATQPCP